VSFGEERAEETAALWPFYAPSGGLEFFTEGHSPLLLEILATGQYINLFGAGGYGPELTAEVPLVSTVPGAPFASYKSLNVTFGSAYKEHGKPIYYYRVPAKCPKGGFPIKTEVIFDGGGANPPVPEPITAAYKSPCPTSSVVEAEPPEPPQTTLPGTGGAITAPAATKCVSRRDFTIHVQQIRGLIYRHVAVEVNGHTVKVINGRRSSARVDLRGLPKGHYSVRITVLTTSGRTLRGTRAYHTCEPKRRPATRPGL
jgi:hypothetical protein